MRLSEHKVDPEGSFTKPLQVCFGRAKRKGVATTTECLPDANVNLSRPGVVLLTPSVATTRRMDSWGPRLRIIALAQAKRPLSSA